MDKKVYEYISKTTNNPIVERKTCKISDKPFAIFQSDIEFYDKVSPVFGDKKYSIPTPTLCPEERERRRLSWRNERKLYRRKCDFSGKEIISIYSPDKSYIIYDQKVRRSDQRDPIQYGRDFDFSKTYTEQFGILIKEVPRPSLHATECENSEYTNHSYYNKNCYYIFGAGHNEDCYFSDQLVSSKNCIECTISEKNTNCFECVSCTNCYACQYCNSCKDSNNCISCTNCTGSNFCINCENLVNKEYYINNKEATKEEYETYKQTKSPHTYHISTQQKAIKINNSEYCIGNEIHNSKNCILTFDMYSCEGCKYMCSDSDSIDSFDCYGSTKSPNTIECLSVINGYNNISNLFSLNSKHIYFSQFIDNCAHIFGCIGLRNKEYCIFNKQYTREEYESLVPKIIEHMIQTGEWGEYFNPKISPFGYNETIAQENYPLNKEETITKGYKRSEYEAPVPQANGQDIRICEVSEKPFRLIPQELEFYRKYNLPLPTKHPDIRHAERLTQRPGRELHLRSCDKCTTEMLSVYPGNYLGKVYCETCYNKEVYS